MTTTYELRRLQLEQQIQIAEDRLQGFNRQLAERNGELDGLMESGQQFQVLSDICVSLDKLDELEAGYLFWGNSTPQEARDKHRARLQVLVGDFQQKVETINQQRDELQHQINADLGEIELLHDDLDEVAHQEERALTDYIIEREEQELPDRPMLLPWLKFKEDQERLRKTFGGVLVFLLLLNLLIIFWEIPEIPPEQVEVPEYLVEMVKKDKPKPKPPEPKPKPKEEEKKEEQKVAKDTPKPKPTPTEKAEARKKAETSGVLAFKDSFNDLLSDEDDMRMGATANLRNKASASKGEASRNLVMSQATASSGGISNAKLSKGIGGAAGGQMGTGISFARVESAIGTDMIADDRPLSDGVGPSRTDEEIQIVFDRYKATLYRIYNRELRNNPLLKGKMVLKLTIEPDGSVSFATVESTNMDSPALVSEVVSRVKRFNFGPKDGVPAVTILYPIDFLPAA